LLPADPSAGPRFDLNCRRCPRLIDAYHRSRYNTITRQLPSAMFNAVTARRRALLDAA